MVNMMGKEMGRTCWASASKLCCRLGVPKSLDSLTQPLVCEHAITPRDC